MKGDDIFWIIFLKVDTFTVKELAFKLNYIYINAAGLRIKLVDIVQRKGNLDLLYVCFLVTRDCKCHYSYGPYILSKC